jgi:hypothetical protein
MTLHNKILGSTFLLDWLPNPPREVALVWFSSKDPATVRRKPKYKMQLKKKKGTKR